VIAGLVGYTAAWAIAAHHFTDVGTELSAFSKLFSTFLFSAALLWVFYVALEPYVRRFWPDGILGWTRLLSGYVRDPRVGRDVLIGCAVGVGLTVVEALYNYLPPFFGYPSAMPFFQSNVTALINVSTTIVALFESMVTGMFVGMFVILGFVVLRL